MVDFENDGGHSVLLMKVGSLPTLTDADFTFRSKELVKGEQVWKLPAFYKRGRNL